jgi:beta-mannosidase
MTWGHPTEIGDPSVLAGTVVVRRYSPRFVDLSGTWRAEIADDDLRRVAFGLEFDDGTWPAIEVPGHWRTTPEFADADGPLIYRSRFELDAGAGGARHWVVLDGVFYQGDVWLDGAYLGDPEGYFFPHAYEITDLARLSTEHVLAVEVTSPPQRDSSRRRVLTGAFTDPDVVDPFWNPGGLWRPVHVERSGPVRIERLRVLCTEADVLRAQLMITAVLDSDAPRTARVRTTVDGRVEREAEFALARGPNRVEWTFGVDNPPLWWPWSLGEQGLATVIVSVSVDHETSDARQVRTGFRQVAMNNWVLSINGERVFLKGVNYEPASLALGDVPPHALRRDLELAKAAGLDLVRVHAHVSRPELYDVADELGVLLWQDLPLQHLFTRTVRRQAVRQATEAVDLLGHHPAIVLWCGHDEPVVMQRNSQHPIDPAAAARYVAAQELPTWNRTILDRSVKRALERADASRPVIAHSGVAPHPPQLNGTDTHVWFGWFHGTDGDLAGFAAAVPRMVRFVSAFGAQSVPPNAEFMAPERWPDLDWEELQVRHSLHGWVFAQRLSPTSYPTFDAWRTASQRYQAELVRSQVEHLRRLKYRPTGGFCVSSLADTHPAVTWSVVDHDRAPKAAYHALAAACQPVIVVADRVGPTVAAGASVALDVHLVSDLHRPLTGVEVTARLRWRGGSYGWRWRGDVDPDSCRRVGTIAFVVPDVPGPLSLDLAAEAAGLSTTNRYESLVVSR